MKNSKMEFGMPTLIENANLEESVMLCTELGLSFVEINMNFPQYQFDQLENISYIQKLAKKNGIYFTIHFDENLNIADFNHSVANAYFETVRRVIDVAKKIQAPVLNMHMNHGIYVTLPDRKVQLYEQYNNYYMDSFRQFRMMCEELIGQENIKICIENTDGFLPFEKQAIEYLLASDIFALTWDIGHSHACNNIDEPFLLQNSNKLSHFHIHDAIGTKNHLTLATGEIDLKQRLAFARDSGCRCVVETKTVDALRKSTDYLKREEYL